MAMDGETIILGADRSCKRCGMVFAEIGIKLNINFQVMFSAAGYFIGTQCSCGPNSRESSYFKSRELAMTALDTGNWIPRGKHFSARLLAIGCL